MPKKNSEAMKCTFHLLYNFRIDEGLEEWGMSTNSVTSLIRQAKQALSEVFDPHTVAEWIEQKLWPLLKDLQQLRQEAAGARQRRTWPRRPLKPLPELVGIAKNANVEAGIILVVSAKTTFGNA